MQEKDFDVILDECVDRLNRGETIEACLAGHPRYAAELEPLLKAMAGTKTAYAFTPSADAKRAARERFYSDMEKRKQPSFWQNFIANRIAVTAAAMVVIAVAGLFALRTWVLQAPIPTIAVSAPNAAGNFAFLVSDEVNALSDFSALNVTIEKVSALQGANSSRWVEFTPEVKEFDLTLLPGNLTQQLWRGDLPEGEYNKVVISVAAVRGTLKSSGEILDIKLPSSKLQLDLPFQVGAANVTSFTYDLTVIKTGGARNTKYLLKPQVGESGANRPSVPVTPPSAAHNQSLGQPPAALPDKAKGKPQT